MTQINFQAESSFFGTKNEVAKGAQTTVSSGQQTDAATTAATTTTTTTSNGLRNEESLKNESLAVKFQLYRIG
jgi:hypothetical protein